MVDELRPSETAPVQAPPPTPPPAPAGWTAPPKRAALVRAKRLPTVSEDLLATRIRARGGQTLSERLRNAPCWLASFVLHLLFIVVLGSMVAPTRARDAVQTLVCFFTSAPLQAGAAQGSPLVTVTMAEVAGEKGTRQPDVGKDKQLADKQPTAIPEQPTPPPTAVADAQPSAGSAVAEGGRRQDLQETAIAARSAGALVPAEPPPLEKMAPAERERHFDDVVGRFIQFDVGRLAGDEGARASRDFELLGPQAVAAMVRGINRSATMAYSCPVIVISQKLEQTLVAHPDPIALEYALRNLGRGVPVSAVHAHIIQALRRRLGGGQATVQLALTEKGIALTPASEKSLTTLSRASTDVLAKALENPKRELRMIAILALYHRAGRAPLPVKAKLMRALIHVVHEAGAEREVRALLAALCDQPEAEKQPDIAEGLLPQDLNMSNYRSQCETLQRAARKLEFSEGPLPSLESYQRIVQPFLDATRPEPVDER